MHVNGASLAEERVEDPELKGTAEALQKSGKAGYQENMVRVYLEIFRQDEV